MVAIYGQTISRLKPRTYTLTFVCCDIISLILQAAGGAIAASASTTDTSADKMGVNIMIAGLAFQVASLVLFMGLAIDFALRARKASEGELDPGFADLRSREMFRLFPYGKPIFHVLPR